MTRLARPIRVVDVDAEVAKQIRTAVADGLPVLQVARLFGVSRWVAARIAQGVIFVPPVDVPDDHPDFGLPPGEWVRDPAKPWRLIYQPDPIEPEPGDLEARRRRREAEQRLIQEREQRRAESKERRRQEAQRRKDEGRIPRCGTSNAYQWHLALDEQCQVCREADSARRWALRERKRAEREAS